jgi:cell division protein ZipA
LAAELRWILLGLSVPLLLFVWWWTARRAGQTPGRVELRESAPKDPAPKLEPRSDELLLDGAKPAPAPMSRDWGVPPFEPLSIRTAEFDRVPVLDGPMLAHGHPAVEDLSVDSSTKAAPPETAAPEPANHEEAAHVPAAPPARAAPVSTTGPVGETGDRFATAAAPEPNAAQTQKIVTVRVCTMGEARWPGTQLMAALELHGLAFGRYQVFHRRHTDGRSLFCVASLIEPGTFDMDTMAEMEFRGVTLFAVLPGPLAPLETMDELLRTARGLGDELSGMVQDAKGVPLSPQRAAALREEVARFQASMGTRQTEDRESL